MKLLAIRLARFGDIVLLLPALTRLKSGFPDAQLSFLTGHRCAPLAALCPAIDEVISVDRIAMRDGPPHRALANMARLVRDIRRHRFDWVVDCHGLRETNLLSWLSGAPRRMGLKRFDQSYSGFCFNLPPVLEDKNIHVAEMFMRIAERLAPQGASSTPSIVIPQSERQWARQLLQRRYICLYIDAPVPSRIWPPENFAAVADHVITRWDMDVAVLSGPGGGDLIQRVRRHSRTDRLHSFSELTIPQLSAVIEGADFFVSNDTGPMHLGPALGVQTLGIFSVGLPQHFRPTGPRDGFIQRMPIENISAGEVIERMEKLR